MWWIAADHPDQPAVIGIPDAEWGESVKAVVEVAGGHEPSDGLARELIEFCRSRLAGYKCPRSVDFQEACPEPTAASWSSDC
ncbi:MAG: fadD4 3 [Actinomycetia bacterium]|nr:fadD4 3 [Actinomycetes bacterium]